MKDPLFQTKSDITRLLEDVGRSPRKRFGQHFLIDGNLMRKLVSTAEIDATDCVIEVGPGTGSLTRYLAAAARRVVAAEIDADLAEIVTEQTRESGNVEIVRGDALATKSTLSPVFVDRIRAAAADCPGKLLLVANLPYDIATPLLMDLLISDLPVRRYCFTVQSEMADRLLAAHSTRDYGPVAILTQSLATGRTVCRLPPSAFWPRPAVDSTMVRLDARDPTTTVVQNPAGFAKFVRSFFTHRRKTMMYGAKRLNAVDQMTETMVRLGIPDRARPENVTVPQWIELFEQVG